MSNRLHSWRLGATVFTLVGLALAIATSGVYAILGCDLSQRRKEIGIRSALGARAPAISAQIMLGASHYRGRRS